MNRSIFGLGLCVSLATLAAACDDGSSSNAGGGGSTTTATGGGTTTSSTTGSGGTTSSHMGGGGAGGTGGVGGTGGTGGVGGTGGTAGAGGVGGTGGTAGMGGMAGMGGTAGMGGMGGMGGAGGMTMMPTTSQQIAAVRAAMDGSGLALAINGAIVTYTKPALGLDSAGFFLQAEAAGPAIFIAVDPASLMPAPKVGDELDLVVNTVETSAGLKQVTAINNVVLVSTGNPVTPLVTEVSMSNDLVMNLDQYESRAIKITGNLSANFISAGSPQVATPIVTMGLNDPNLRLRMPETVRATYDLTAMCSVTVDYGVMWRFNAVAQPSAYAATDLKNMTCPAPTVVSAISLSLTEVVVTFDRKLDPATVDAADFTFDNGLMASAVMVNGNTVTVTTNAETPGTTYTLTAMNLNDVLGKAIGMPNTATFQAYVPVAQVLFNELNSNITGGRDLIELLVTAGGSTNGITLHQKGSADETLATLPDVIVATNDLIVIHLTPVGTTGIAGASEIAGKAEFPKAMFSANYDGAWDFLGAAIGLSFSNRVLEAQGPAGAVLDAVPVVVSNSGNPPAAFPGVLQLLQAAGGWFPADCTGQLCTYMSTPTAVAISVDYLGSANNPTGNSVSRQPNLTNKTKSDWNAAGPNSWGLVNP